MLLEITCGHRLMVVIDEDVIHLAQWVCRSHYGRGTIVDAANARLNGEFNITEMEMETVMVVGLWCVHLDRNLRLSIRQGVNVLWSEMTVPRLPPRMLMVTFLPLSDAFYYLSSVAIGTNNSSTGKDTIETSTLLEIRSTLLHESSVNQIDIICFFHRDIHPAGHNII
ncbi:hypothetical protein PR202_gb24224 [Eleusine coracana subsp. coracana]|uniref:Uncharacterized protein n=1 Tax=Eleusine coracana subsp. coracana TaxID=191504 RepID=A0AAV5FME5_ELECO|nr:hypothetical protein PR202_gb24224 [Eleusine coracana subsp. coracana]